MTEPGVEYDEESEPGQMRYPDACPFCDEPPGFHSADCPARNDDDV